MKRILLIRSKPNSFGNQFQWNYMTYASSRSSDPQTNIGPLQTSTVSASARVRVRKQRVMGSAVIRMLPQTNIRPLQTST